MENFRKFRAPTVLLQGLTPGLVVVAAGNEAGKSTMLAALRAAFFYKHTWSGRLVDALRPHGADVDPVVSVTFVQDHQTYIIRKQFRGKKRASLKNPAGDELHGDEAEERLATLLGLPTPGHAPHDEGGLTEGPLGLLWVRQGAAWSANTSDTAQTGLRDAVGSEVGDVLGGERAEGVVKAISSRRDELLTPGKAEPKGALKAATESERMLESSIAGLQNELEQQEASRAHLAGDVAKLTELGRQLPQRQEALESARTRLKEVKDRQELINDLKIKAEAEKRKSELAQKDLDRLDQLQKLAGEREGELGRRRDAVEQAQQNHTVLEQAARHAAKAAVDAGAAYTAAEERHAMKEKWAELQQVRSQLKQFKDHGEAARREHGDGLRCEAEASRLPDRNAMTKLRKSNTARVSAEAALAAASATVSVRLAEGFEATWDGNAVDGSPLHISEHATLVLKRGAEDVARVEIAPGAGAADPREHCRKCSESWRTQAAALGVQTIEEAEQLAEKRNGLEAKAARNR
ncbi:MAG: AAA family ATPase, partial [Solirubrobacteraceae bacterium]